jgi:hypothetical protein
LLKGERELAPPKLQSPISTLNNFQKCHEEEEPEAAGAASVAVVDEEAAVSAVEVALAVVSTIWYPITASLNFSQ